MAHVHSRKKIRQLCQGSFINFQSLKYHKSRPFKVEKTMSIHFLNNSKTTAKNSKKRLLRPPICQITHVNLAKSVDFGFKFRSSSFKLASLLPKIKKNVPLDSKRELKNKYFYYRFSFNYKFSELNTPSLPVRQSARMPVRQTALTAVRLPKVILDGSQRAIFFLINPADFSQWRAFARRQRKAPDMGSQGQEVSNFFKREIISEVS